MAKQLRSATNNARLQPILLLALILLVFAASYGASTLLSSNIGPAQSAPAPTPSSGGAARVTPPYHVSDFTLTSKTGEPMSLSDLHGKPTMLMFGYTHCPDVCPLTLAQYEQVKGVLGDTANDVNFLFISVDGERDTPEVVTDYLEQ
ncbi:MAG: SCO family protein, partial [Anaerolineae bacterium]|nr:SCO family protein [Anaerolineae bacterium]